MRLYLVFLNKRFLALLVLTIGRWIYNTFGISNKLVGVMSLKCPAWMFITAAVSWERDNWGTSILAYAPADAADTDPPKWALLNAGVDGLMVCGWWVWFNQAWQDRQRAKSRKPAPPPKYNNELFNDYKALLGGIAELPPIVISPMGWPDDAPHWYAAWGHHDLKLVALHCLLQHDCTGRPVHTYFRETGEVCTETDPPIPFYEIADEGKPVTLINADCKTFRRHDEEIHIGQLKNYLSLLEEVRESGGTVAAATEKKP